MYSILQLTTYLQAERSSIISELKPLTAENRQYNEVFNEKIKEMEPLRNSLGKFREENNAMRAQGAGLCSSIEELEQTVCLEPFCKINFDLFDV
jgi:archaellum component FlaC